jgi:hypothetical protein
MFWLSKIEQLEQMAHPEVESLTTQQDKLSGQHH